MANLVPPELAGLIRIIKHKLKNIRYRPHLIDGSLLGPA
jgi:hypothetical protein